MSQAISRWNLYVQDALPCRSKAFRGFTNKWVKHSFKRENGHWEGWMSASICTRGNYSVIVDIFCIKTFHMQIRWEIASYISTTCASIFTDIFVKKTRHKLMQYSSFILSVNPQTNDKQLRIHNSICICCSNYGEYSTIFQSFDTKEYWSMPK